MSNDDPQVQRIVKLLRLARDQPDQPEGKTAAKLAGLLQKKLGIEVELEDEDEAQEKSAMLVVESEPIAWEEFLGTTMATVYRCDHAPRWTGASWQFWIYSEDADRVAICQDHFKYLHEQIYFRSRRLATRQLGRSLIERENMAQSYAEGLVVEASIRILARLGWHDAPPFVESGFDLEKYSAEARDPLEPTVEDNGEPGLRRYRYRAAPHEETLADEVHNAPPPPQRPMDTDLSVFARGRHDVGYLRLIPGRLEDAFR